MRAMMGALFFFLIVLFSADGAENPWKLVQADSTGGTNLVNLTNLTFKGTSTYTNGSGLLGTENEIFNCPLPVAGSSSAGIAANSNGTKLVYGVPNGYLYTSTDAGTNWVQRNVVSNWQDIASSADGNVLAALAYPGINGFGQISISWDSGVAWSRCGPIARWQWVCMSEDGTKMAATVLGVAAAASNIYTSVDAGTNWTEQTGSGARLWLTIASSSSGAILYAVTSGEGIYKSVDYGTNWSKLVGSPGGQTPIACSADGTYVTVPLWGNYIYTSWDSGATWVTRTGLGPQIWYTIVLSKDGKIQVAAIPYGGMAISTDYGKTWKIYFVAGRFYWMYLAGNYTGTRFNVTGNLIEPTAFDFSSTKSTITGFGSVESGNYIVWEDVPDTSVLVVSDGGSMSETAAIGRYYTLTGGYPYYLNGDPSSYRILDWGGLIALTEITETYYYYGDDGTLVPQWFPNSDGVWTGTAYVDYARKLVTNFVADAYGVNSDFIQGANATNWNQSAVNSSSWTNWKALHSGILTNNLTWTYTDRGTNWGPMLSAPSLITRITSQAYSGGMTASVYIRHWTNDWGNATLLGTMPCIVAPQQSNWSWAVPATTEVGVVWGDGMLMQKVDFCVEVLQ